MRRAVVARLAAGIDLAGCGETSPGLMPDPVRIDVDTPQLRRMKAEAGVEHCRPGDYEMPVLQACYEEYGDRVRMLGIDYQDPQSSLNGADSFPVLRGMPFLALVDEHLGIGL